MNTEPVCSTKCFYWTPIVIGAFFAIGLSFLLNLFTTAIGLSIYTVDAAGMSKLTVGGMLGFAVGIIIIMFFSGWIAGYFGKSHCNKKECSAVYGFGTWCLALILAILLSVPASKFAENYSTSLGNTVTTVAVTTVTDTTNTNAAQTQQAINDLGKGAFVIFLMFFLGALASTCGGYVGGCACCCKTCCESKECNKHTLSH